jgi:uncharacterized protein YecT (DUF1311 family)
MDTMRRLIHALATAALVSLATAAPPAIAQQAGAACGTGDQLPAGFTCFDRKVFDCRSAEASAGLVACGRFRMRAFERELDALYNQLLEKVAAREKSKSALQQSQAAWYRSAEADCEFVAGLAAGGNPNVRASVDCYADRLQERIGTLKRLREAL